MSTDKETREWYISFGEERGMPGVRTWLYLYSRTLPNSIEKLDERWIAGECHHVQHDYANQLRDMFKEAFQNVFTDDEKKDMWWNTTHMFIPNNYLTWQIFKPFLTSGGITRDKSEMETIEKNCLEVFKKHFLNERFY